MSTDPQIAADAALMARIAAGDERACRALIDAHAGWALAVAERMLGGRADAQDVLQEAFLRAWRAAADWRADAPVGAWLRRVVVNLCLDRLRKPRTEDIDAAPEAALPTTDGREEVESADLGRRVARAVGALPERQRAAIVLCAFEGRSAAEAAAALDATEGGVESLLVRARRTLKTQLGALAAAAFGGE